MPEFGLSFSDLVPFILIGFAAQLVDGALGMAFGVISTTLLISVGVPPAAASAGVHTVECFTTGVSGISHVLHKNVRLKLFLKLLVPGAIGGILGAYVLTRVDAALARPFVLAYLSCIGLYLLWRGLMYPPKPKEPKMVEPLAVVGGFLDASGGGGWGPIVTSNLLVQGAPPRQVIGSVNAAEFFITVLVSATFIASLGLEVFSGAVLGLLIGGVAAAPLGAVLAKRIATKPLLILVGVVLTLTSAYGVWNALR